MRTKCIAIGLWAATVWTLGLGAVPGRAQPGPDDDGAVVRNPFEDAPRATSAAPVRSTAPTPGARAESSTVDQILGQLSVDPRYAKNRDIQPTPDLGPWMICIHSYVTKEAPEWARQMTGELRTRYKLPAYVFTYGVEERRKEFERVKMLLDKQREFVMDRNLPIMYAPRARSEKEYVSPILSDDLPLAYAMSQLKVNVTPMQCAVLVGGYADSVAANRALEGIRKLPDPDPERVKLDVKFYAPDDPERWGKLKKDSGLAVYVNPFKRAFVCRNPSLKQERLQDGTDAFDMKVLRHLNANEPLTLLNCKKPITLALKQFQTYTAVETRDAPASMLDNLGFKTRNGDGVDQAAHDAHSLGEFLRKNKLEAYVLHTKYSSIVSVGGYDSLEDPNLRAMQTTMETRLRAPEWQRLMFLPKPMPMKVPH